MDLLEPGTLEYSILQQFLFQEGGIKPGKIAKQLCKERSTINSAIERMGKKGILRWDKYNEIRLLNKGRNELKHIETHLHLIEVFLVDTLSISTKKAYKESLRLAPHFSCELIEKICNQYNKPEVCPNRRIIPHHPACHSHD